MNTPIAQFAADYASHRAAEGRGLKGRELQALPYLRSGSLAKQWAVRARSFDAFVKHVLKKQAHPLDILDLGAGNGWLCYRVAGMGHKAVAADIRRDDVDGLGAAVEFLYGAPALFERVIASFDDLPFESQCFDVTLFNASLHYARDLARVLQEARRVTRHGALLVILDSPFYPRDEDGAAMVAEKHMRERSRFGVRADVLLGQNFIEYLTRERLTAAQPALIWSRHRVRYPLWYEMRPLLARLKGTRKPSRFDLWMARVP